MLLDSKSSDKKIIDSNSATDIEVNKTFVDSLLRMIESKYDDDFSNLSAKKGCCQKINNTMTALHWTVMSEVASLRARKQRILKQIY